MKVILLLLLVTLSCLVCLPAFAEDRVLSQQLSCCDNDNGVSGNPTLEVSQDLGGMVLKSVVTGIEVSKPDKPPELDQIKGLRFINKVPYINEQGKKKKRKLYIYELVDGSVYISYEKLPGVTDLTKFDEVHPRLAKLRDTVSFLATIISFTSLIVLLFI